MIGSLLAVDGNCPVDQFDGGLVASIRIGNHSEQMQAIGLTGIDGQNLPINSLSLGQPPSLVASHFGGGRRASLGPFRLDRCKKREPYTLPKAICGPPWCTKVRGCSRPPGKII